MESDAEHLAEHAVELVSAARQLADSVADPSTAMHLPAALARVGEALDALTSPSSARRTRSSPPAIRSSRSAADSTGRPRLAGDLRVRRAVVRTSGAAPQLPLRGRRNAATVPPGMRTCQRAARRMTAPGRALVRPIDASSRRRLTSLARAPDNELYDRGADLVEAAMAIRRVAGSPEASRAVPAVLGCIESALQELEGRRRRWNRPWRRSHRPRPIVWTGVLDRVAERMHRGYANLQEALFDAHAAAAAARSLTSRALGRPSRRS